MTAAEADDRALIERLEHAFAEGSPGVVSAYLFGSHARGAPHRDSDVDVGVLLDWSALATKRQRFERRVRLSSELGRRLGRGDVDVVVLNDAPPHLGRRIVTEGLRVHCAESEVDRAFQRDVQLRAADLEPFLRRMRRIKLEALAR